MKQIKKRRNFTSGGSMPTLISVFVRIILWCGDPGFLPPANEVCEDYVFTGVCLFTGGGVCLWSRGVGRHPPGQTHTSPGQTHTSLGRHSSPLGRHPPGHIPPRHTLPWADTPPSRHPLADSQQAVRIPLECILLYIIFKYTQLTTKLNAAG